MAQNSLCSVKETMMRRLLASALVAAGVFLATSSLWGQAAEQQPRASIGIGVEPMTGAGHTGLTVREVTPDSPAAKAGLQNGDIITKVGDKDVKNFDDLVNMLSKHKPGDKVSMQVQRAGQTKKFDVTLGERQHVFGQGEKRNPERGPAFLGVQTREMSTAAEGAEVSEVLPGTPADKAGLKEGDVITSFDGKAVAGPEALREEVGQTRVGKQVTLKVMRGKETKELKATLAEIPSDLRLMPYGNFPGGVAPGTEMPFHPETVRIQRLERRIEQLEKRIRDLEKKQGSTEHK
jgi:S1-C subfamily serine protease